MFPLLLFDFYGVDDRLSLRLVALLSFFEFFVHLLVEAR